MCHLHDLRGCGLASAFFPSLFAPKDRLALSTAFSTEIEPSVLSSKSKISLFDVASPTTTSARAGLGSGTIIASETGFPDLIVPAGMTKEGLPVTISFIGTAFSEQKLLGYGYDFEQATKGSRRTQNDARPSR